MESFLLTNAPKQDCPVPRFAPPRPAPPRPVRVKHAPDTPPPDAAEKPERSSGGAPRAAHWACSAGAGRAGLRAASRKPSPSGGCGRERRECWAAELDARSAGTHATRVSAGRAISSRLCNQPPPPPDHPRLPWRRAPAVVLLRLRALSSGSSARAAAGPGTRALGTRPRCRSARRGALLACRRARATGLVSPGFFPAELRKGRSPPVRPAQPSPARSPDGAAAGATRAPTEP